MKKQLLTFMAGIAMSLAGSYATAGEISCTFNPENESQLTELSTFQITYSEAVNLDWVEAVDVLRDGRKVCGLTAEIAKDKKTVTYTLTTPQTEEGTYTFANLDYSVWPLRADDYVPYIDLTYYIGEPKELEPVVYTNPSESTPQSVLREVLISFNNVKSLQIDSSKSVTMSDGTNSYEYKLEDCSTVGHPSVLALPVDEELDFRKGGKYTLVIEDGALILNGKEYGYTFTFTVAESLQLVSSDPAEGATTAEALENITLTFNNEITGFTGYMIQGLQLRRVDENGNAIANVADYTPTIDPVDARIVHLTAIDGVDIDEPGSFYLNLPPTLFIAGTQKNYAMIINYTVEGSSAISAIAADCGTVNVYTVGGVKVIDNGTPDAVSTLRPGLYIINGKTVLVK